MDRHLLLKWQVQTHKREGKFYKIWHYSMISKTRQKGQRWHWTSASLECKCSQIERNAETNLSSCKCHKDPKCPKAFCTIFFSDGWASAELVRTSAGPAQTHPVHRQVRGEAIWFIFLLQRNHWWSWCFFSLSVNRLKYTCEHITFPCGVEFESAPSICLL